jgi:methionyl-tRNA formyltransferase
LKSLIEDFQKDLEVKLVVSQADKPVGRKKILEPTPVKKVAQENNLEVLQPEKLKPSSQPSPLREKEQEQIALFYEKLNSLDLDFIVVVAYGKIVPKEVLEAPKYGCINIH